MATCFITQGIDLQSRSGQCFLVKTDETHIVEEDRAEIQTEIDHLKLDK